MMPTMETFTLLLAIVLMLYLNPGDYMSSSDTIGAFEPLSSTNRCSNSANPSRKERGLASADDQPSSSTGKSYKSIVEKKRSLSNKRAFVVPDDQPLPTGKYTSVDVHAKEIELDRLPRRKEFVEPEPIPSTSKAFLEPEPIPSTSKAYVESNPMPSTSKAASTEAPFESPFEVPTTDTTSSRQDRFFRKKPKESKDLIPSYLDSILDSDVLNYYEQNMGSIHSEDMDVENLFDELCVQTYVMSAHLMVHGDANQKESAYMSICRDCHHFFVSDKECLDNSINMSIKNDNEKETVIKVPLLGLQYAKSNKSDQSFLVNFPVTYILSKLTSSVLNMDSYDTKSMSITCDILRKKLERDINENLVKFPSHMGIFSDYILSYKENFKNEMSNNIKDLSDPLHSCKELLRSFENMEILTTSLLNKSGTKYAEHRASQKKMESFVFSIFNFNYREYDINVHIKLIYDFSHIIYGIIERVKKVYNNDIKFLFLKDLETPEFFFLRNNLNIKNICSINIIATISWFFNQVNMGLYNKNKTVPYLFMKKFSYKNIEKIVKMESIQKNVPKEYITDLCINTMAEMVDMVAVPASPPPPQTRKAVTPKFTFSNIIKYAEMSLLKERLNVLLVEDTSDGGSSNESQKDIQTLQKNFWARENFICLMKIFSSKMNFHLSGLQKSFLQKLTLENYKSYAILNRPLDDRNHMYFCSLPGEKKDLLTWLKEKENVSFVIAHPDDEIMFFFPTIKLLFEKKKKEEIFLLSLTNGDFYSQGKIREKELYHVWSYLGGVKNNCKVMNDPDVQDGSALWNDQHLADILADYCTRCNISNKRFLTFRLMYLYRSQFVYYRILFCLFSQYAYFNAFDLIS
ncbi:hypothetical protein PVMG_02067 [Plasmodium vivax Mauritania I]|uniref:N-acetylglucosaminylphosphatidylinositol deacetylase n=1 Tax=Plasmodium vivax Mauritania I TaxID=1035515 RepID=A0A0J9TAJ2_PLAVI|nr:hypothetical protein PVMG_02067 [Plasmodium vivax Mauritania I]